MTVRLFWRTSRTNRNASHDTFLKSNRVGIIRKFSNVDQWRYVSSKENPADIATHPQRPSDLANSIWLTGPKFLKQDNYDDPKPLEENVEMPEQIRELRVFKTTVSEVSVLTEICTRSHNWNSALLVTRNVLKVKALADKARQKVGKSLAPRNSEISNNDATKALVRISQQENFNDVFQILKNRQELPENHRISLLSPFIDRENILRVGGRLSRSSIPSDRKHPMLLPENHAVTKLVLVHHHETVGHQGNHLTHGSLRENGFHIMNGKTLIRKMIENCVICRRLRAPLMTQVMADLPADRLEETPPFTNTGLDVFGHYFVHDGKNTRRNNATKKVWAIIFVCLVTRAIHIEMLPSMDTSSFRNALRRFLAIRGTCRVLRSDNGTNFVAAKRQMERREQLNVEEIRDELMTKNCEWKFNPAAASHCGGSWERKIGCVRRILDKTLLLNPRHLSRDELSTLLQEAAAIFNNTPLWEVSEHPDDPMPLSPATLLTLKEEPNPPCPDEYSETDMLSYGKLRWRRVQHLAGQFWVRWRRDYLSKLQERRKWKSKKVNLAKGDIVLIRNKCEKRNKWPTGRVEEVFTSEDNLVRSVKLLLPAKDKKQPRRYIQRSIHDLVLLLKSPSVSSDNETSAARSCSGAECDVRHV